MKTIDDYIGKCTTYMLIKGLNENPKIEKDVENDLQLLFGGTEMDCEIQSQVKCDAEGDQAEEYYVIDLVIKALDGYLPIELKHSVSATEKEMEEDIKKLHFYVNHYYDMPMGILMYYSDKKDDALAHKFGLKSEFKLMDEKNGFYYLFIGRDQSYDKNKAISFDSRWEEKVTANN